ncbi:uncharacterized protein LOC128387039 [Panonychus citri]|uniref:uncharacterized protein LOC128387039 n=1 Tax=Panonychus citri TaxID=50023 RepID=UPI0023073204|nr:uncharacterized protein LOC128387039 [Panonychus citri]
MFVVCRLWNNLVKRKLVKVRELHLEGFEDEIPKNEVYHIYETSCIHSSYHSVYTNDLRFVEKVNVSKLLPNLKYFKTSNVDGQQCVCKATINVLSTSNTLIGLKDESPCYKSYFNLNPHAHIDKVVRHCDNLKHFEALVDFSKFSLHPEATDSFARLMAKMPNLETLTLLCEPEIEPPEWPKPKINLKQLKIRNIDIESSTLQVLSLFPELPSLHLSFEQREEAKAFPTSRIHPDVQDLALDILTIGERMRFFIQPAPYSGEDVDCGKLLKSVLANFPNCKNLMIRIRYGFTENDSVFKIIEMLPNLNLFVLHIDDIKDTWKDPAYFDTVDKHCKSIGRRIAFYTVIDVSFHKKIRYSVNEDIASPFNTDNQFIQKYFRRLFCDNVFS